MIALARTDLRASLIDAVSMVDLLDLAGRIQADPQRVRVSTADQLALAMGVEAMWEICLNAIATVRTIDLAADAAGEEAKRLHNQLLTNLSEIRERMSALTGTYEEN